MKSFPVINVRGTSGSGKSTLIRRLIEMYPEKLPVHVPGRKQPIMYKLTGSDVLEDVAVIGHYETACGGCDTITSQDRVFEIVRAQMKETAVIFEGLLISAEFNRTKALDDDCDLYVVQLDTPLQTCLDSVNMRRKEKKPDAEEVNPKNTESKWKGTRKTCERLEEAGVAVFTGDRDACLKHVEGILHG